MKKKKPKVFGTIHINVTSKTIGRLQIIFGLVFVLFALVSTILMYRGFVNTSLMSGSSLTRLWHESKISAGANYDFIEPLVTGNLLSFMIQGSVTLRMGFYLFILLEAIILGIGIMLSLDGAAKIVKLGNKKKK